jgi:tetratricopeptide (TPR) repeat protein
MFLEKSNSMRSFVKYTLFVFIAVFPFILYRLYLYNGTSSRSVTLTLVIEIIAITLGLVLLGKDKIVKFAKSPITLALFLYFIILIISSIQGIDPLVSFWSKATRMTGLFYFSHLAMFYIFMMMVFQKEKDTRSFLKVFLISTGIFSVASLLGPEGLGWIYKTKPWDGFTLGNSSFAAMYLFVAFLLSIYYIYTQDKKVWWKYFIPLVFIINPNFISKKFWFGNVDVLKDPLSLVGEARATTYVVLASMVILGLIALISKLKNARTRRIILKTSVVAGVLVTVLAMQSFLSKDGYIQQYYLKQATSARPVVWELSSKAIAEKTLFGWGPDNFEVVFQKHYDNRLLQEEYGAEAWFDRAHNIFIDQATDTGYVGLIVYCLMYLVIIGSMMYVILYSKERKDQVLGIILLVYFPMHLIELQTAFDTSISYVPLAIMAALAATLFHKTYTAKKGLEKSEWIISKSIRYVIAIVLIGFFGWALLWGTFPIMKAEIANGEIRTIGTSEKRLPLYKLMFGSPMDPMSFLWRISTDFQRGIAEDPEVLNNPKKVEGLLKELAVYESEYKRYISIHPEDVRAKLNLADTLIYQNLFGLNKLEEAQTVLDSVIASNPTMPQAYWMKSVAYLYSKKFDLARDWAKKGLEINPDIKQSQQIVSYIEDSIKTFPEINLYFFRQI